ncbi:MAG: apolipoprotein N-acyltransferase [Ruminococcus sp.]|nr:apolipoprotein N-acyltransferase [Ruminococcus sp.]
MKKNIKKFITAENLLIFSGIFCGLMQGLLDLPLLSLICFAPPIYGLIHAEGIFRFLTRFMKFYAPYYIVQTAFLVTVSTFAPINKFLAAVILTLAVILLSLWLCLLTLIPAYFFVWLKPVLAGKLILQIPILALLITGGEWLAEHIFFLSFPWSGVWLSAVGSPILMQGANLLGAYFVSFLLLTSGGLFAEAAVSVKRRRGLLFPIAFAGLVSAIFIYGGLSVSHLKKLSEKSESLSVVCAQDNAEGTKKSELTALDCAERYKGIITSADETDADLILLPETAIPSDYDEAREEFVLLSALREKLGCTVVSGCFINSGKPYNGMLAFSENGVCEPYCKQRLVPFGEYDPFSFISGASTLCKCSDKELTAPLHTDDMTIGCGICIESIYPSLIKAQAKGGAELICISTNDSWFGRSFARNQHYRHSIMRAVENSRWTLRSGNCGISAIISPWGEVSAELTENVQGTVSGEISLISEKSLFSRTGDIFITLPAGLIVWAMLVRYGKKNNSDKTESNN